MVSQGTVAKRTTLTHLPLSLQLHFRLVYPFLQMAAFRMVASAGVTTLMAAVARSGEREEKVELEASPTRQQTIKPSHFPYPPHPHPPPPIPMFIPKVPLRRQLRLHHTTNSNTPLAQAQQVPHHHITTRRMPPIQCQDTMVQGTLHFRSLCSIRAYLSLAYLVCRIRNRFHLLECRPHRRRTHTPPLHLRMVPCRHQILNTKVSYHSPKLITPTTHTPCHPTRTHHTHPMVGIPLRRGRLTMGTRAMWDTALLHQPLR